MRKTSKEFNPLFSVEKRDKVFYNLRNIAFSDKNGGIDMAFLTSLLGYLGKLVFYVILAVIGVFAGKKLRERKDAKTALEDTGANTKEGM